MNKRSVGEYMYKRAGTQWSSNSIKQLMSGESLNRRREGGFTCIKEQLHNGAVKELNS